VCHYPERMTTARSDAAPPSRRAEYAEQTRTAIVAAARELFLTNGYVRTKVDDIAARARVSPATVYAVAGGKQGLLHTLVREWTHAPELEAIYAAIDRAATAREVLDITASGTLRMRRDWGDVMKIVLATAAVDDTAASQLTAATERYRAGMTVAARRLAALDALAAGVTEEHAVDVLWYFFGYAGYFTLVEDNAWTLERASEWLRDAAARELLR
jgi:AcrR family transcriptional regulator